MDIIDCVEPECLGQINFEETVMVPIGQRPKESHPCTACRTLYWPCGIAVVNGQGQKAVAVGVEVVWLDVPSRPASVVSARA